MRRSWTTGWRATAAAVLCAVGVAGCSSVQTSGIDPTGEHVFAPPPPPPANANLSDLRYFDDPMNRLPWDDVAVLIDPSPIVAPVGSEVVLIAGVAGPDGYLRTNRRLEWSISPGGVGSFVSVEQGSTTDLLLGDFNWPRVVNNSFAVGSTSRSNVRLNRGACTPLNDKFVLRGQGWVSLTSPVEGTSYVTVVAPEVYSWDARVKSATVHWVDATVQYPAPAISPAGATHEFVTTVLRSSNQSPCENWRVRYEIVGGPAAGFAPDLAQSIEVRTNSAGQARATIAQKQPASGVNKICIHVIRPADAPGSGGQSLALGNGGTTMTWSASDLAVHVGGPATAIVGATLIYQIELSNPGDLAAKDATAMLNVPDGLTYLGANPAAEAAGRQLRWRLGELGARQRRTIEVSFRAERQGNVSACCDATAAGGLKARECTTTTIATVAAPSPTASAPTASALDVEVTASQATVNVGEKVTFTIALSNRGTTPLANLRIKVRLDPGLEHDSTNAETAMERKLEKLSAGETQRFGVAVRVTKPGRLCQTVDVTAPNMTPANGQACITAIAGAAAPPTGAPATPLSVTMTGPPKPVAVGQTATFTFDVKNTGSVALRNVKVVDRYDPAFEPTKATDGWRIESSTLAWNIDELLAGQTARFAIECTCQTAAAKVYNRAAATLSDGSHADGEFSLEILKAEKPASPAVPPPTGAAPPTTSAGEGLTISVDGLSNPVRPGKELTYEIRVANKGTVSYRQIAVVAGSPAGMTPIALGTVGATINGQAIDFGRIQELAPGQTQIYRARVLAKQPGNYRFHVELTGPDLPKPIAKDSDETEVRN